MRWHIFLLSNQLRQSCKYYITRKKPLETNHFFILVQHFGFDNSNFKTQYSLFDVRKLFVRVQVSVGRVRAWRPFFFFNWRVFVLAEWRRSPAMYASKEQIPEMEAFRVFFGRDKGLKFINYESHDVVKRLSSCRKILLACFPKPSLCIPAFGAKIYSYRLFLYRIRYSIVFASKLRHYNYFFV